MTAAEGLGTGAGAGGEVGLGDGVVIAGTVAEGAGAAETGARCDPSPSSSGARVTLVWTHEKRAAAASTIAAFRGRSFTPGPTGNVGGIVFAGGSERALWPRFARAASRPEPRGWVAE